MAVFDFNFKFLKENATAGAWRRGYEYYQKEMILQSYPEKNFYMGKVKGNFQEAYNTDLIFKKNKVEARCSCPLKDEWCKHAVAVAIKAINELSVYAGSRGMIGGQMIDMTDNTNSDDDVLFEMYRLKTGALLKTACAIGCILAGADDDQVQIIEKVAYEIGVAFQIQDDILALSFLRVYALFFSLR